MLPNIQMPPESFHKLPVQMLDQNKEVWKMQRSVSCLALSVRRSVPDRRQREQPYRL